MVTTSYIISLKRLQPSTTLLTTLSIHSCSPPIHYPRCRKHKLYKTQINVTLLQKESPSVLSHYVVPATYHPHSTLRFIHIAAYYPKVKIMQNYAWLRMHTYVVKIKGKTQKYIKENSGWWLLQEGRKEGNEGKRR